MKKIVIASACRTAIGKFGGTLANVPAVELGSIVIKEALNRANVAPEQVDHVYMGCVIQAGLGQNVARQAALKAAEGSLRLPHGRSYGQERDRGYHGQRCSVGCLRLQQAHGHDR